jgi:hypothetical protein
MDHRPDHHSDKQQALDKAVLRAKDRIQRAVPIFEKPLVSNERLLTLYKDFERVVNKILAGHYPDADVWERTQSTVEALLLAKKQYEAAVSRPPKLRPGGTQMVDRTMRQRVPTVATNAGEAERPPDIIEDIRFWSKVKVNFVDFIETLQRHTMRTDEMQWRRIQKAIYIYWRSSSVRYSPCPTCEAV